MKILINRTDVIGDMILTIPIARAIKYRYKDAYISFLVTKTTLPLFEKERSVDELIVLDNKRSKIYQYLQLRKLFKNSNYDAYLYVGGTHLPSFAARFAKVEIRGGLKSRWPSFLTLNSGVRQKRSSVEMHEYNYNMALLKPFGINLSLEEQSQFYPKIDLSEEEISRSLDSLKDELKESAQVHMTKYVDELRYIVIHPGMTGHTLNLPAADYAKVLFEVEKRYKKQFMFIISYTAGDKKYIDSFKAEVERLIIDEVLRPNIFYLDGSIRGLRDYMGVVSKTSLFIGPSTGPLHIANGLGRKILGVYSPILIQSSSRWGPIPREYKRVRIAVPSVVCGEQFDCLGSDCPYYECMERIGIDYITDHIKDLLSKD